MQPSHSCSQINASRYPVWASLAHDYLAIMATSVLSEQAFSQGGIMIWDRRTRLKADVVEALQFSEVHYPQGPTRAGCCPRVRA